MLPKEPTPSDRAPHQSAPFSMPSPFPAPEPAPRRGRRALWTVAGVLIGIAAKWFLASHGLPAPLVDEAAQGLRDALPK